MFSRAVFIHNKIEREVEIILTPAASGPQCIGFPAINLTHQTAPFSPRMTYLGCYTIITSNSCSTLRFPLGVLHFIALHKCIILYICHYKFIQSILTAIKILRALPIHLPPPSPLATTHLSVVSTVLRFPYCHAVGSIQVCSLFRLASLS